jgi:hypothetical protein
MYIYMLIATYTHLYIKYSSIGDIGWKEKKDL